MQIVAKKSDLLHVATVAANVADDSGTMASYKSIVLTSSEKSLLARASSGQQQVELMTKVDVSVDGTVMVNAKDFMRRIDAFDSGDIRIKTDDRQMLISQGVCRVHRLAVLEGYLPSHVKAPHIGIRFNSAHLTYALRRTNPSMCDDMSRPSLSGIRITPNGNASTILAVDNTRMARVDADFSVESEFLIPPSGVRHILTMYEKTPDEIAISSDNSRIFIIGSDGMMYSTSFVSGPYVDLSRFFPQKDGPSFVFKQKDGMSALQFVLSGKPHLDRVRVARREGGFSFSASNDSGGASEEFVPCTVSDGCGFSASLKNFMAAMLFFGDEVVRFTTVPGDRYVGDCPGPCLVTSEESHGEFVVSPYIYDKEDLM